MVAILGVASGRSSVLKIVITVKGLRKPPRGSRGLLFYLYPKKGHLLERWFTDSIYKNMLKLLNNDSIL